MNDSPPGEPPEPLTETRGANGAATAEPDASGGPAGPAEFEGLRNEVAALRQEASDAKDLARRAQADLANVRRRARNERAEFRSRALEEISSALLPVLDDLHRAVAEAGKTTERWTDDEGEGPVPGVVRGLHEGVRLVLRRFQDTLRRQGLSEIEACGSVFDPRLHEAVQETPAKPGQRDGEVVEVLRRGYLLDGRVIRPATVIVAAGSAEQPEEADTSGAGDEGSGDDSPPGPPPTESATEPLPA